jgi:2-polyprenyl-3-methyl-5-hydroxy-6-metoxy-1,4-benzoquinol methylase
MNYKNHKIIKNKLGYYEVYPKPSITELKDYYNQKYFQNESGNYRSKYTHDEYTYLKNKEVRKIYILENFLNISKSSLLDVGCGEGFSLCHFHAVGWDVLGIDFSDYGIKKNNPDMINNFIQGDLIEKMKDLIDHEQTFDVITLNNLLEHVVDPNHTIDLTLKLLTDNGILIIEVPNDFSNYQSSLKKSNFINENYWIAYPDHLSYFNRESLNNLLNSKNMNEVFSLSDFPIDIFLSNIQSNYVLDKGKGMDAHKSRIFIDNYFNNVSIEKTIKLYEAMAEIGFGRQIISFYKKNNNEI